jgi:ATP-dependent RNA helicase DDX54/DBP10
MPHRAASPAVSENEFDITRSLFKDDDGGDGESFGVATDRDVAALDAGGIFDFALESDGEGDEAFIAAKQAASNRKASNVKGKSVKKGGGFQAMGMNTFQRRGALINYP